MKRLLILLFPICACLPASAATFNIEIDYMVDTDHTHMPTTAEINAVVQTFACQGHTLNIDVDDAIPHVNVLVRNPSDCDSSLFGYDNGAYSSFGQIRQDYFDHDGQAGWFYGVFAHQYQNTSCNTSGSSGLSNGGQFFIVTMGSFSGETGTPFDKASTLFHEFGHNLGLSHCGTQYCGGDTGAANYVGPYVPNMPSNMAYQYQLRGVETNIECQGLSVPDSLFKEIDYSHGIMCGVNEDSLNEFVGSYMTELDWDCDGIIEASVAQNINNSSSGWCGAGGNRTTVSDYNEWANLSPGVALLAASESGDADDLREAGYRFIDPDDLQTVQETATEFLLTNKFPHLRDELLDAAATGDVEMLNQARVLTIDPDDQSTIKQFASQVLEERRIQNDESPCISPEEDVAINGLRASCPQPTLFTESCLGGDNSYVGTLFIIQAGTCLFPWSSVQSAHAGEPAGSTFYMEPKTYDETGATVLNKRGVWTCYRTDGGSSAIIR